MRSGQYDGSLRDHFFPGMKLVRGHAVGRAPTLRTAISRPQLRSLQAAVLLALAFDLAGPPAVAFGFRSAPAPDGCPGRSGISEKALVGILMPEGETSAWRDLTGGAASKSEVVACREIHLGVRGRRFFVVAVESAAETVPNLSRLDIGIVDLDRKRLLWKTATERVELVGKLRFFPGVAGAKASGFAFREHLDTDFALETTRERWFQPRFDDQGVLQCEEIWSGFLEYASGAVRGGRKEWSCGHVRRASGATGWTYEIHRFMGGACAAEVNVSQESWHSLSCDARVRLKARCGLAEIRRIERWKIENRQPVHLSVAIRRLDHGRDTAFPFNLPQRFLRWTIASRAGNGDSARPQTTGEFRFRRGSHDSFGDTVDLVDGGERVVRTIIPGDLHGYGCTVESLGWSEDGKRAFAIVRLDSERALLSFSVSGADDYWERTLTEDEARWPEDFRVVTASGSSK